MRDRLNKRFFFFDFRTTMLITRVRTFGNVRHAPAWISVEKQMARIRQQSRKELLLKLCNFFIFFFYPYIDSIQKNKHRIYHFHPHLIRNRNFNLKI